MNTITRVSARSQSIRSWFKMKLPIGSRIESIAKSPKSIVASLDIPLTLAPLSEEWLLEREASSAGDANASPVFKEGSLRGIPQNYH